MIGGALGALPIAAGQKLYLKLVIRLRGAP